MKYWIIISILILSTLVKADYAPLVFPDDKPYGFFDSFETMYVSVYTFTSEDIGARIANSNTILLVEGSPVGGIPDRELLCSLNVSVYLYKGEKRYLHAKYAVKDNSSFFVSTENFGSFSNRGWGAVVRDNTSVLLKTFFEDLAEAELLECGEINNKEYYKRSSQSFQFTGGKVSVFTDNHLENLISFIRGEQDLAIEQFYFYKNCKDEESPLIKELVGKNVRVLLDGEWYNREKNEETVKYLQSLGVEAKIEDSSLTFHTKGLVGRRALVSSINWNENSITNNREVGVVIDGDVSKFRQSFEQDWKEEEENNSLINIFIFIAVVIVAYFLAKRKIP